MAAEDFHINDLVWAKMKGFPPWPAKIAKPNSKPPKKKSHFVVFFGAKNVAWISDKNITPHSESVLNNVANNKSSSYQKAIEELLTFIKSSQQDKQYSAKHEGIIPKKEKGRKGCRRKSAIHKNCDEKKESTCMKKVTRKRPLDIKFKELGECTSPKIQKCLSDDLLVGSTSYPNFAMDKITIWEDTNISHLDYDAHDLRHYTAVRRKLFSPIRKRIGFIGLGIIGKTVVTNLLQSRHDITIWNKTAHKCDIFVEMGARMAQSPADIIAECEITFCSVSDPDASKEIVFGNDGILKGLAQIQKLDQISRGYIELSSINPETSKKIETAIVANGGKYLEAPICGDINSGLIIIAAGDKNLFFEAKYCFHAMFKHAHFVNSNVGVGSQMSLLLHMFSGAVYAALAEILGLISCLGLDEDQFLQLLSVGPLQYTNIIEQCRRMMIGNFKATMPLKHMQKDLHLTLLMGNQSSMPLTAASNELFKCAIKQNYSNSDISAVYQGLH